MASIAGVSCTYGLPDIDEREERISIGESTDGSIKFVRHDTSRRIITIPIKGLSTSDKNSLLSSLESSTNQMVRLSPDLHVDLGGGAGVAVDAQVLDGELGFIKTNHEKWDGVLTYGLGFISFTPNEDIMYAKLKVKIEGVQSAPETFITNSGKLQYNYGTTAYPNINLTNYVVSVICNGTPYQEATINQVGDVSQSGGNISFQLSISDGGKPSGDGYYYADIIIALQAKV